MKFLDTIKTKLGVAVASVKATVVNIPTTVRANRASLADGSVLSPNTHPSYSPKHVADLNLRDSEYARRHAELRTELGFDW